LTKRGELQSKGRDVPWRGNFGRNPEGLYDEEGLGDTEQKHQKTQKKGENIRSVGGKGIRFEKRRGGTIGSETLDKQRERTDKYPKGKRKKSPRGEHLGTSPSEERGRIFWGGWGGVTGQRRRKKVQKKRKFSKKLGGEGRGRQWGRRNDSRGKKKKKQLTDSGKGFVRSNAGKGKSQKKGKVKNKGVGGGNERSR